MVVVVPCLICSSWDVFFIHTIFSSVHIFPWGEKVSKRPNFLSCRVVTQSPKNDEPVLCRGIRLLLTMTKSKRIPITSGDADLLISILWNWAVPNRPWPNSQGKSMVSARHALAEHGICHAGPRMAKGRQLCLAHAHFRRGGGKLRHNSDWCQGLSVEEISLLPLLCLFHIISVSYAKSVIPLIHRNTSNG